MCLMIGFDAVKMAEVIDPPSDRVIGFMLTVGKAVKPAMPKGGQLALSEVAVQDRFASPKARQGYRGVCPTAASQSPCGRRAAERPPKPSIRLRHGPAGKCGPRIPTRYPSRSHPPRR